MSKARRAMVAAGLAACTLGCAREEAPDDKPLVFVSIAPQAYFVERIAGDAVDVAVLMPPGGGHLDYDPRPSQMRALSRAGLYVRIGLSFETRTWPKIRSINPVMRVVDGLDGIDLLSPGNGPARQRQDPHVWLNPRNVVPQAQAIGAALAEMIPERAGEFEANTQIFLGELEALDQELIALFEPVRGKGFWVYHPTWEYFAEAYGIIQYAVEHEGKEPGTRSLAREVDRAKASKTAVIFVEPMLSQEKAAEIGGEIGATVRVIDPYAKDYIANLRAAAHAIAEALT